MGNIELIVDDLEDKICKVLSKNDVLLAANLKLTKELEQFQNTVQNQALKISGWKERYETLKMANTILGSDNDKRETKLKINALIRDIDHCIGQLSE